MKTTLIKVRVRGFSLVELMIAVTLGLLLTAVMIQLFSGTRITFATIDAQARVQESGRFALETLKRELREAGTHGFCAAQLNIRNHLNDDETMDDILDFGRAVVGWEYGNTGRNQTFELPVDLTPPSSGPWTATDIGGLPAAIRGRVVPGSDVLLLRRMEPAAGVTAAANNSNQSGALSLEIDSSLTGSNGHGMANNPVALVTDCATGADLFQVTNNENASSFSCGSGGNAAPGNASGGGGGCDWSTVYNDSMQVFRLHITAYYIGMSERGEPGLYRVDLSRDHTGIVREELVGGIENMQVLYGFSRAAPAGDGRSVQPGDWLSASQIPADGWSQVVGLRVAFTARSPDIADGELTAQTFNLSDADIQFQADGRIRHPFSSTIALRNRLIVL